MRESKPVDRLMLIYRGKLKMKHSCKVSESFQAFVTE